MHFERGLAWSSFWKIDQMCKILKSGLDLQTCKIIENFMKKAFWEFLNLFFSRCALHVIFGSNYMIPITRIWTSIMDCVRIAIIDLCTMIFCSRKFSFSAIFRRMQKHLFFVLSNFVKPIYVKSSSTIA